MESSGLMTEENIRFEDQQFDEFVVGMPSAAAVGGGNRDPGTSGTATASMFEVEILERWVGERSRLVIGLSTEAQRGPTFRSHLGGEAGGNSVGIDVSGEKVGDHERGRPSVGDAICYASNLYAGPTLWGNGKVERVVGGDECTAVTAVGDSSSKEVPIEKVLWRQQSLRTKPMVVGVALDGNRVRYFVDGAEQHDLESQAPKASSAASPMFPAISGTNCSAKLRLNADGPFKYPLQPRAGRGFADLAVGDLPSHAAALHGHLSCVLPMVEGLARGGLLGERGGKDDSTLLCLCASSPSGGKEAGAVVTQLLEALLKAGANPNVTDAE